MIAAPLPLTAQSVPLTVAYPPSVPVALLAVVVVIEAPVPNGMKLIAEPTFRVIAPSVIDAGCPLPFTLTVDPPVSVVAEKCLRHRR